VGGRTGGAARGRPEDGVTGVGGSDTGPQRPAGRHAERLVGCAGAAGDRPAALDGGAQRDPGPARRAVWRAAADAQGAARHRRPDLARGRPVRGEVGVPARPGRAVGGRATGPRAFGEARRRRRPDRAHPGQGSGQVHRRRRGNAGVAPAGRLAAADLALRRAVERVGAGRPGIDRGGGRAWRALPAVADAGRRLPLPIPQRAR
jgi:hypothetical protein